jgi:hypothetical protein
MLHNTVSDLKKANAKVCLFIDGLDEFEGDHEQLVSLIADMIQRERLKV